MSRLFIPIGSLFLFLLTAVGVGLCSDDAADSAAGVLIRAVVKPQENIVVGQRVILRVDVLAPDGWAQIKQVGDFSIEGAQAIRYESQGTRLNETIQGRSYSGQRYELSLFPRRNGTMTVPSIPVEVEVSRWGGKNAKQSKQTSTPAVTFEVQTPPGAENIDGLISTSDLTATQRWEPRQEIYKVGDAIKRTIELSGRDVSGMAFAPLRFESNQMVSLYPAEPIVDDSFNRGTLNGKRVESVTYVFTAEGMAELPEIIIPWWDIEKKKLQRAVLEARRLEIVPAPTAAGGGNGTGVSREQFGALPGWLLIILLTLAILLIPTVFFRRQIYSRWQQWQQARRERESFFFRQFVKSARSNDPKAAFNSLMRWLDRIHTGPGAARLDVFLNQYGNKSSSAEAGRLEQALSEGRCDWTGKPLTKAMRAARQHWQKARQTGEAIMSLPPLNPS